MLRTLTVKQGSNPPLFPLAYIIKLMQGTTGARNTKHVVRKPEGNKESVISHFLYV